LAILIAVNAAVWIQRDAIADWWKLRDYTPSKSIAALATDTTMTGYARHLFYVNHPVLEDKQSFNGHCADHDEETAVLGCYHGDRQGIYVYAVDDSRLDGVRQVTAAHEMLHQAFDRLSGSERKRIAKLLQDYYDNGLAEQDVMAKLDSYKKQPNVDLVNEMHSIFGSEVRNLPRGLEDYYKQYFNDRLKVVSYSESYQGEFTRRKELVDQYDAQLQTLKAQINTDKSELGSKLASLKAKEKEINQDLAAQDQTKYASDVNTYNAMVDAYNTLLATTRNLITQHNQIVTDRNAIAVQEQELQQALDSRLTPSVKQ
jgi:hypothetical protein